MAPVAPSAVPDLQTEWLALRTFTPHDVACAGDACHAHRLRARLRGDARPVEAAP